MTSRKRETEFPTFHLRPEQTPKVVVEGKAQAKLAILHSLQRVRLTTSHRLGSMSDCVALNRINEVTSR